MGWLSITAGRISGGILRSLPSVRIVSGAMQLARMPNGPAWSASAWVNSSIPALAAPYAIGDRALGRRAAADDIVIMLPRPRAFIPGRHAFTVRNVAVRFASMLALQSSTLSSSTGPGATGLPPALATSTSIGPSSRSIAVIAKRNRKPYHSDVRDAAAAETRERIVAVACDLLDANGPPSFSVDAAGRAAGVTRLTVYNQFESKRGLLEAAFDRMARTGGLFEIPTVFAAPDLDAALRRLVSLFCQFWRAHRNALPRITAFARLDEEIAAGMRERSERRRQLLTALVSRFRRGQPAPALVDTLFALTSFEFYEQLDRGDRPTTDVERIIQDLVADVTRRYVT
jgi:AcrR family transcriptional regulator